MAKKKLSYTKQEKKTGVVVPLKKRPGVLLSPALQKLLKK